MAKLSTKPYSDFPAGVGGWRERYDAQSKKMTELKAASNALPDGEVVGAVLQWQVADGYASYIVTKASPLTLAALPFADEYTVSPVLIRGLRKGDVLEMLASARRWRARQRETLEGA